MSSSTASPFSEAPAVTAGRARSDIALSVQNVSKSYVLSHGDGKNQTAREAIVRRLSRPFDKPSSETFWALQNLSFDVYRGEVVGVIGRNGAGKSTLLKILSRITEPTKGQIDLYGRVGSLLEVGTGFHNELTGRENIFLNGAILGMRRREIQRHFDDIVEFAEVTKFLDTPVKRYSSGMYVRLAFAVAAHLSSDIMIVDEVLAVGDAEFQKRCLGKMEDVAKSGRTVLFVSHHMPSVLTLCNRGILLKQGKVVADGPVAEIVDQYVGQGMDQTAEVAYDENTAPGGDDARIRAIRVRNLAGELSSEHYISSPIVLEMDFECIGRALRLNASFHVFNAHNVCLFATANMADAQTGRRIYEPGLYRARCVIPGHLLNDGPHMVSSFVTRDSSAILASDAQSISFNVTDDGSSRGDYTGGWTGAMRPDLPWTIETITGKAAS